MTALAVGFGWAWGLFDWQMAEALGLTENAVRRMRRELGLRKRGMGRPDRRMQT
jgi:hypothetical protein